MASSPPSRGQAVAAASSGPVCQEARAVSPGVRPTADGHEFGFAAAKGCSGDGVEIEVLGASVRSRDWQVNAQASAASGRWTSQDGSLEISAETFTAKGTLGGKNADGSTGFNIAVGTTLVGAEGTWKRGADSVTFGLSVGTGAELSVGVRDIDNDGIDEVCRRTSLLFFTLGWCRELDGKPSVIP